MYKKYLNEEMLKTFQNNLEQYHDVVPDIACKGTVLENLLARSLQESCRNAYPNTFVEWDPESHNKGPDITIHEYLENPSKKCSLSVKSGQVSSVKDEYYLNISGSRLQSAIEDAEEKNHTDNWLVHGDSIIEHIENIQKKSPVLSVASEKDAYGFTYRMSIIKPKLLTTLPNANEWEKRGNAFFTQNKDGVIATIKPSLSWQIWWTIPVKKILLIDKIRVNTDTNYLDDRMTITDLITQNGLHLIRASKDFKNDPEIVLMAYKNSGDSALEYASLEIQDKCKKGNPEEVLNELINKKRQKLEKEDTKNQNFSLKF